MAQRVRDNPAVSAARNSGHWSIYFLRLPGTAVIMIELSNSALNCTRARRDLGTDRFVPNTPPTEIAGKKGIWNFNRGKCTEQNRLSDRLSLFKVNLDELI